VSAVSSRTRSAAPQEACRARQFSALRGGLCVCKEACGNHLLVSEAARDPQSVAQGSRRFFCVLLGESDEGYAQERVGFVFDVRQLATEFRRPLKVQPGCVVVAFFERDVSRVVVREGKGERVTAAQCHLGGLVVERLSAFEVALQLNCQGEREERSRDHGTVSAGAAELEALFAPPLRSGVVAESARHVRCSIEELAFEVAEQEQQLALSNMGSEVVLCPDDVRDRLCHERGITHCGEADPEDARLERRHELRRRFDGKPCLARTTGAGQRKQARAIRKHRDERVALPLSANK
jgi:hypothetical protein